MNEVKELKIDSTLWATPAKIINLLDFKPEKLSIKNFSFNNKVLLNMIFSNDDQKNEYHQVWKEIFKIVDNENGELNLHEKILLSDSDIPTDKIIKISSVTIITMSLVEKDNH